MTDVMQNLFFIGKGIVLTMQLLTGGMLIGVLLGTLLSICRHQGVACFVINRFISILRGTPLILQLSFIYFAVPVLLGMRPSILVAGIVAFGLNSSAYFAEILRAGIESLPKGQFEAALTLQIPTFYLWKDIILPQVARNIFPAMINEMIALLKETALDFYYWRHGFNAPGSNIGSTTIYLLYAFMYHGFLLLQFGLTP